MYSAGNVIAALPASRVRRRTDSYFCSGAALGNPIIRSTAPIPAGIDMVPSPFPLVGDGETVRALLDCVNLLLTARDLDERPVELDHGARPQQRQRAGEVGAEPVEHRVDPPLPRRRQA